MQMCPLHCAFTEQWQINISLNVCYGGPSSSVAHLTTDWTFDRIRLKPAQYVVDGCIRDSPEADQLLYSPSLRRSHACKLPPDGKHEVKQKASSQNYRNKLLSDNPIASTLLTQRKADRFHNAQR